MDTGFYCLFRLLCTCIYVILCSQFAPCFPAGQSSRHVPFMWQPLPRQLLGHEVLQSAPYRPGGHTVDKQYTTLCSLSVNRLLSKLMGHEILHSALYILGGHTVCKKCIIWNLFKLYKHIILQLNDNVLYYDMISKSSRVWAWSWDNLRQNLSLKDRYNWFCLSSLPVSS